MTGFPHDRRDPNKRQVYLHVEDLEGLIANAYAKGHAEALKAIGLDDEGAPKDIRDIRELITSWRQLKASAYSGMASIAAKFLTFVLLGGLMILLGSSKWFKAWIGGGL